MELEKGNISKVRPYLVFSSVGQYAKVGSWFGKNRLYDIWLTDYSGKPNRWAEQAEYLNYRKGAKWPNLYAAFQAYPDIFRKYRAIWVADDDLALSPGNINTLFLYLEKYQLSAAQPSFNALGKNGYRITEENPVCKLRFTNFAEVGSTVLKMDILFSFMKSYDPTLIGYGVDWILMHHIKANVGRKVAIIDEVRCFNPPDSAKGGRREIDVLQSRDERKMRFEEIKSAQGITIDQRGPQEFDRIYQLNPFKLFYRVFRKFIVDKVKRRLRWFFLKHQVRKAS